VILKSVFMKMGPNLKYMRAISRKRDGFNHVPRRRCQYLQKSTLGLVRITSATTRST
jgi:hypothetical protein